MKLILSYFGETGIKSCKMCSNCIDQNQLFVPKSAADDIRTLLKIKPAELDEIAAKLQTHTKETLLENLILLLDSGEIRMLDFRTYALA